VILKGTTSRPPGNVFLHIGGAAHRDAEAVDGGLHGHEDEVECHARLLGEIGRLPGRCQPQPPVVAVGIGGVQQHVIPEVLGAFQRLVAIEQARAAHREQFIRHQPVRAHAGPLAASIADRGIDIVALEID